MTTTETKRAPATVGTEIEGESINAPATIEHSAGFVSAYDAQRFRVRLERRADNREQLITWIREHLVDGVDFGRIHVVKKETCDKGKWCENEYHFSKPSLWKPGAEKICGMLGWTPTFPNLTDYTRLIRAGREIKQIVLVCDMYSGDAVIGQGIGARLVAADGGDLNKALKMAKKSAHIDATLISAGLSEVFTQDYGDDDDPENDEQGRRPADQYAAGTPAGPDSMPRRGSASIDVHTHCTIGKHRGDAWPDVPGDYLEWIAGHITDKPQLVAAANAEINRRKAGATPPDDYDPKRPHLQGSGELATHARALALADSAASLESAWTAVPEKFRKSLLGTYEDRQKKLKQRVRQERARTGDDDDKPM